MNIPSTAELRVSELALLRSQYFQLQDPHLFRWPTDDVLIDPNTQEWLFMNLFDGENVVFQPPKRYHFRVLKILLEKLEGAICDPDEDEISDSLTSCFSSLLSSSLPSELVSVQQKSYVSYACGSTNKQGLVDSMQWISLLESRAVISSSGTTGLRTWEAAIYLGQLFTSEHGDALVRGKRILELGAGTGYLSILCRKFCEAKQVVATDGEPVVVEAIASNIAINGLQHDDGISCRALLWGQQLPDKDGDDYLGYGDIDFVIGADVVSHDEISLIS